MIKIEHVQTYGWEAAIRGMRNPMNSWDRSDSELCKGAAGFEDCHVSPLGECPRSNDFQEDVFCIGSNDLTLMKKLCNGGSVHRKYMRMIFVSMDITAPLYWWKEFDTYKVGTVANSCSTMHRIHSKEFILDDFSHEHLFDFMPEETEHDSQHILEITVDWLNRMREKYLETKNKDYWWQMIQLLPSSYNQKRTVTFSYENVAEFIKWRTGHKLDEWNDLVAVLWDLPYVKELLGKEES